VKKYDLFFHDKLRRVIDYSNDINFACEKFNWNVVVDIVITIVLYTAVMRDLGVLLDSELFFYHLDYTFSQYSKCWDSHVLLHVLFLLLMVYDCYITS
jgi:hypothetical protein